MTDQEQRAMTCPVTILGHTCGATIDEQNKGEMVMLNGKGWIVCRNCAVRGVRELDVAHAEPVLDIGGE